VNANKGTEQAEGACRTQRVHGVLLVVPPRIGGALTKEKREATKAIQTKTTDCLKDKSGKYKR